MFVHVCVCGGLMDICGGRTDMCGVGWGGGGRSE